MVPRFVNLKFHGLRQAAELVGKLVGLKFILSGRDPSHRNALKCLELVDRADPALYNLKSRLVDGSSRFLDKEARYKSIFVAGSIFRRGDAEKRHLGTDLHMEPIPPSIWSPTCGLSNSNRK
jgi:hypothetical protein